VGEEVVRAFIQAKAQAEAYFLPGAAPGKWQADLAALARQRWQALGIDAIYGNDSSTGWCTVANPSRFFSHRRDSSIFGSTGRMAAAIVRTV
jgi:copper oxidase (laccase) domain-containing protein